MSSALSASSGEAPPDLTAVDTAEGFEDGEEECKGQAHVRSRR